MKQIYKQHVVVCAICAAYSIVFGEAFIGMMFGVTAILADIFMAQEVAFEQWKEKEWNGLQDLIQNQYYEVARARAALSELEYDLWNMTNAVHDADWCGTVEIFGEVVAHKKAYHQIHVDRLETMARFARAAQQKETK